MAGAIVLLTALAYIPAMRAGFIWDDDDFLTNNPLVQASDGLRRFWFSTEPPDYFPLVSSSLWVEWRLWGMNATGYHVVNVLLHAISSVLVWRVLRKLRIPGAWLAGLIFAVHPVNVESVAWITERKNVFPMVFYLLSILCYLRSEDKRNRRWYLLSLGSFLLALLSKTSVVMLPVVLLGCVWWRRGRVERTDVVRTIPFFCLAVALGLLTIWFQYNRSIADTVVRTDSLLSRLAIAGCAVWFYLYKAVIPHGLAFVYPRWQIAPSSVLSYVPDFVLLVCLATFVWYRKGWGRPFLAGIGYCVITLLPVLGFLNIYFMRYSLVADHWQYTSIIGVIALGVGLAAGFANRRPGALRILGILPGLAVVGLFSVLTWRQACIYGDRETLWRDTLAKSPRSAMPHSNLGGILLEQGKTEEAIEHFREALRINPNEPEAHHDLANALVSQGKLDEAIPSYGEALRLRPGYAKAHYNLANALAAQGRLDEAVTHYTAAIRALPTYAMAHSNLGHALARLGRLDEAIAHYVETVRLDPACAEAHHNLANALVGRGRLDEAVAHYTESLRLLPADAKTHYNLATALSRQGRLDEAMGHYTEALRLDPTHAEAHNNLALTLAGQGKFDEAITHYVEALRLNPTFAEAHCNLANAFAHQDRLDEAVAHYRKAIQINTGFAEAHKRLGAVLERQGKLDEAIREYQDALRLNPQDSELQDRLEKTLGRQAQPESS